jgi:hypothetical protein
VARFRGLAVPGWSADASDDPVIVLAITVSGPPQPLGVHITRNIPEILPLPIDRVKPYAQHARLHPRHKRRKLEALIRRFGQATPILVDDSLTLSTVTPSSMR